MEDQGSARARLEDIHGEQEQGDCKVRGTCCLAIAMFHDLVCFDLLEICLLLKMISLPHEIANDIMDQRDRTACLAKYAADCTLSG